MNKLFAFGDVKNLTAICYRQTLANLFLIHKFLCDEMLINHHYSRGLAATREDLCERIRLNYAHSFNFQEFPATSPESFVLHEVECGNFKGK